MSGASDNFDTARPLSGARAYARLDARAELPRRRGDDAMKVPATAPLPEAVTPYRGSKVRKPGPDRLFVWLRAGFLGMTILAVIGTVSGAAYAMLTPTAPNPEGPIASPLQEEPAEEPDSAARTVASLTERLAALRSDVNLAEQRVEAHKRQHGLRSSSRELFGTQSIARLDAEMIAARTRETEAEAAYSELLAGVDGSKGESPQSAAMSSLRAQLVELKQQLDAESMIYGPRHPTIARLQTQVQSVEGELAAEAARLVRAAKVRADETKAAFAALGAEVDAVRASISADAEALVQLRDLERDAAAKAVIYEAFLSRAREIAEHEQTEGADTRATSATVPQSARTWRPRTLLGMAAGAAAGLTLGIVLAIGLGLRRDMRRTPGTGRPGGA